jgi:hypothetical protein
LNALGFDDDANKVFHSPHPPFVSPHPYSLFADVVKYVFISWTGEATPILRKGSSGQHVDDVARFFKGFHVQIAARSEDDVAPSVILEQVKKASGAKYSVHNEAPQKPDIPSKPVGSGYQKPTIMAGNATQIRGRFESNRAEEDEKARRQAEGLDIFSTRSKHFTPAINTLTWT